MVDLWYIKYGDNLDTIDPQIVIPRVQEIIQQQDPSAQLREVRVMPLTIAFKVNHPNWQVQRINGKKQLVDIRAKKPGAIPVIVWVIVGLISFALITYLAVEVMKTVRAYLDYSIETREYRCPGDPNRPNEECGLHSDAQGNPLVFGIKTEFLAHVASAHATAYQWLDQSGVLDRDLGEKSWFEQIFEWVPIIIILIGAAILIPLIIKVIPGGKKE